MVGKSMWIKQLAFGLLFSFPLLPACYAEKKAAKNLSEEQAYRGWTSLTFDYLNDKEVFSLKLPPGADGVECEDMRKQKEKILCGSSDEIWVRWRSDTIPSRVLNIGIESYKTDHMDLKESLITFNAKTWRADTVSSFSKSYNGAPLYFKDIVDSRFSDSEPKKRRRVASFETKNRFFANFSFAESEVQGQKEKSVPQKDWKLEPIVEKILSSIVFAKDLGTPVVLPK